VLLEWAKSNRVGTIYTSINLHRESVVDKIMAKRNIFFFKKRHLPDFIVLIFRRNCKKSLKMNINAKSKISLDTKCNGDIDVMAHYNFS